MPGRGGGPGSPAGVPNVARSLPAVRNFADGNGGINELPYTVRGVTKDAAGAALGSCTVVLLRTADDSVAARTTSDGGGNYRMDASPVIQHRADAYLPGSPDVAGTTVNTLVGTPD